MTMRKPSEAERIHNLEREMETRKIFLQAAVDEITELEGKYKSGDQSKKTVARLFELQIIARNHRNWINAHKTEIKNYYKPIYTVA